MLPILIVFVLTYLLIIFPFAYFRHDDWLIIGNAEFHLPGHWNFAWKPTLFYAQQEVTWFFRPFFKMGTYVFFHWFGFQYWLWLTALLLLVAAALFFGGLTIEFLSGSKTKSKIFVALFCASVYFHFGSLVWMGEGMMNCPQLFLLSLSTYLFCVGCESFGWQYFAALLAFVLSFGFKESSVFQLGMLGVLLWGEPRFGSLSHRARMLRLLPFVLVCGGYLWIRLAMPMHPAYTHFRWAFLIKPALLLIAGPVVLLSWLYATYGTWDVFSFREERLRKLMYLGMFLFSVLPYFGHGFFSSGWLLAPGFFFSFFLVLLFSEGTERLSGIRFRVAASVLLLLSAAPLLWRLDQVGWWYWHIPQHQIDHIVAESADSGIREGVILDCPSQLKKSAGLNEVIGFEAGLYFLWALHHPKPIPFTIVACDAAEKSSYLRLPDKLVLKWEFPNFTVIQWSPKRLASMPQPQDRAQSKSNPSQPPGLLSHKS